MTETLTLQKKNTQHPFEVEKVRKDFPILHQKIHGKPLVYFDNAATTQKPKKVIEALTQYYENDNANIHRGVHELSQRATSKYEEVRHKVKEWIGASETQEIIFVKGTTEAINLVAHSFGEKWIKPGDEIILTTMEHHSNIVPWQILQSQRGAKLNILPVNDRGELLVEDFEKLLSKKTKLVSLCHVSNSLGTINPIKELIAIAHKHQVPVFIDGAQGVAHQKINVQDLDCDFYAFSGHKMFGPTGIGILYGKKALLEQLPPYQSGGDMILEVNFEKTTFNSPPHKFEAGTPPIASVVGLGAAIDYLNHLGLNLIHQYEQSLLQYGTEVLEKIPGLRLIGTAKEKIGILSFVLQDIHPHDIGTILDQEGVAIRTGHHCTQPLMTHYGLPATARASLAFYNTREEIDRLAEAIKKVQEVFS